MMDGLDKDFSALDGLASDNDFSALDDLAGVGPKKPKTAKAPTPTVPKSLSQPELEDVLRKAGWPEDKIGTMGAIGMAESSLDSSGRAKINSYNPGRGAGGRPTKEQSIGLWQINMHPDLKRPYDRKRLAEDPAYNAQVALELYNQRQQQGKNGLTHWGAYNDKRYKKFLNTNPSLDSVADDNTPQVDFKVDGLATPPAASQEEINAFQQMFGKQIQSSPGNLPSASKQPVSPGESPVTPSPAATLPAAETAAVPATQPKYEFEKTGKLAGGLTYKGKVGNAYTAENADGDKYTLNEDKKAWELSGPAKNAYDTKGGVYTLAPDQGRLPDGQTRRTKDGVNYLFRPDGRIQVEGSVLPPDWALGRTPPRTPLPNDPVAQRAYQNRVKQGIPDTEEFRQKFIQGYNAVKAGTAKTVFSPEDQKFLDDLDLAKVQTGTDGVPRVQTEKMQQAGVSAPQAGQSEYERTGQITLKDGSVFKYLPGSDNMAPEDVQAGFKRFQDADGETYLVNPKTGEFKDESLSSIAEKVPIQLVPFSQKTTTPVTEAQKLEAQQVAPVIAKKYGVNPNDAYNFLLERGFTDFSTGQPLAQERYYQSEADFNKAVTTPQQPTMSAHGTPQKDFPQGGGDVYNMTRRGLRDLVKYSQLQEGQRENNALKLIEQGNELSDDQLTKMGIDVAKFKSGRYDDLQMAAAKGRVNKEDVDKLTGELKQSGNYDQYTAPIAAKVKKGLLDKKKGDDEIAAYNQTKAEREKAWSGQPTAIGGTGFGAAKAGGLAPTSPETVQKNVDNDLQRLRKKFGSFTEVENARQRELADEAARQDRLKKTGWLDYIGKSAQNISLGIAKGAMETLPDYLEGSAVWTKPIANTIDSLFGSKSLALGKHPFVTAARDVREFYKKIFPTHSDLDAEFWQGSVPQGIGSSIGMMPSALGGELPIALYSTLQMGGSGYEEAKKSGATETEAQKFALLNSGLFGWTEIVGAGESLQRLNKGPAGVIWRKALTDALKESGEEVFLNEGPQQFGENVIAQMTYDPQRTWDKGFADDVESAGVSAPLVSFAATLLLHIRNRGMIKSVLADDAKNGGQAVRWFGEDGGLYVNGQKAKVTPEMQEVLDRYDATGKEIQDGLEKISEIQREMGSRKTREGVDKIMGLQSVLKGKALQQQLNAATLESMSGVPKPDIAEQAEPEKPIKQPDTEDVGAQDVLNQFGQYEGGQPTVRGLSEEKPAEAPAVAQNETSIEQPKEAMAELHAEAKRVFGLPLVAADDPGLAKKMDITLETESGRRTTKTMTAKDRQAQLQRKGDVIRDLLGCIHG